MSWYLLSIVWLCAIAYGLYWIAGRAGTGRTNAGIFSGSVVLAFILGWAVHGGSPAAVVAVTPSSAPMVNASASAPAVPTPAVRATMDPPLFRESLTELQFPDRVSVRQVVQGFVMVENRSPRKWLAHNALPVLLGIRVLDSGGHVVHEGRSGTHADFAPGAKHRIPFNVLTPDAPGQYTLKVDMVFEGFAWFESFGGKPAMRAMNVE